MKIHEYQAKQVLKRFGVAVPEGRVCVTPEEAEKAFSDLGAPLAVVKAQIHAGGRGKAGGVKLVRSPAEAKAAAEALLGKPLVTHQTGPEGRIVQRVWVETGSKVAKEFYLGIAVDRAQSAPVMMASAEGGVEIEEVAARNPDAILKEKIDPVFGLFPFQARRLAFGIGLGDPKVLRGAVEIMTRLAEAFVKLDCSLAEINPLVLTEEGRVLALDAKINFDDNGLFRHPDVAELRDLAEEDPKEVEAGKWDLSYIALDGNIGCMVNGAGLAMATMDTIKLYGGEPANFLDVGGGADKDRVTAAFKIILSDPHVKGVLVNIFGGIVHCDVIAQGVVDAAREVGLDVPLVVRLEGTNVDKGKEILAASGLALQAASSMDEGARKIVELVAGKGGGK